MGGCSPEAGAGEVRGTSGARPFFRLSQGLSWSKSFLPGLFLGDPGPPPHCHRLPKTNCFSSRRLHLGASCAVNFCQASGRGGGWGGCGILTLSGGVRVRNPAKVRVGILWSREVWAGPRISRNMEEATYLTNRCVKLPEGHFPLQPSYICLFITLVLTQQAAMGLGIFLALAH